MTRRTPHAALFLDRDGVINVERNYVHRIEDFEFVEGIFDLCRAAADRKMPIVVITNQAGIGRGYYSEQQFNTLTRWMCEQFVAQRAPLSAVYFCPFHPEYGVGEYRKESFERKPNPGMILRARDELSIDLTRSVLVGDKGSDVQAGKSAGIGTTVLLGEDVESSLPTRSVCRLADVIPLLSLVESS